jgi:hypothetical protein
VHTHPLGWTSAEQGLESLLRADRRWHAAHVLLAEKVLVAVGFVALLTCVVLLAVAGL